MHTLSGRAGCAKPIALRNGGERRREAAEVEALVAAVAEKHPLGVARTAAHLTLLAHDGEHVRSAHHRRPAGPVCRRPASSPAPDSVEGAVPLVPRARAAGARRGGGGVGRGEHEAVTHILRVQQVVLPEDLEVGAEWGGEAAELGGVLDREGAAEGGQAPVAHQPAALRPLHRPVPQIHKGSLRLTDAAAAADAVSRLLELPRARLVPPRRRHGVRLHRPLAQRHAPLERVVEAREAARQALLRRRRRDWPLSGDGPLLLLALALLPLRCLDGRRLAPQQLLRRLFIVRQLDVVLAAASERGRVGAGPGVEVGQRAARSAAQPDAVAAAALRHEGRGVMR
mmetsp:Transcript_24916/g.73390  ORF Transcript_24916/g.73390 Transcript_24916/m.73390 type:complete len:341 (+) Transcript_24916:1238-2260(+)